MTTDELLALGSALVIAVRKNIKYSGNMTKIFEGNEDSFLYRSIDNQLPYVQSGPVRTFNRPYLALKMGVGYCTEVSSVVVTLARIIHLERGQQVYCGKYYISMLQCPGHSFCLIHQDSRLHGAPLGQVVAYQFCELSQNAALKDAIVVDPWIYKASKLSDWHSHLEHAKLFSCREFYGGKIISGEFSAEISGDAETVTPNDFNNVFSKAQNDFNEAYESELDKLKRGSISFAQGRRLSDVRGSLQKNIGLSLPLIHLRMFIERLQSKSSIWYAINMDGGKKQVIYQALIDYLEQCIITCNYYPLGEVLDIALKMAPLIRGSSAPKNVTFNNLHMTKTALGLFDSNVIPEQKHVFEKSTLLILDNIRDIRSRYSNSNTRERYMHLITLIYGEKFDLSKLYSKNILQTLHQELQHNKTFSTIYDYCTKKLIHMSIPTTRISAA